MAKSSLQFIERRKVVVLKSDQSRALAKHDCGVVFCLAGGQGQAVTLPTISQAGEGWNCRFVVTGTQNDLTVRAASTITAATGDDIVTRFNNATGAEATRIAVAGTAASKADGLDTTGIAARAGAGQDELTKEDFTILVPLAAGGTGTTFRIFLKTTDAALTADNSAAGQFEISMQNLNDSQLAAQIIKIIKGDAPFAAGVRVPASGDGSAAAGGILGLTANVGTDGDKEIDLVATRVGVAGDTITVAYHHGAHATANADIIGANNSITLAGGADQTGVAISGQVISVTPSGATIGDRLDFSVEGGKWMVRGARKD